MQLRLRCGVTEAPVARTASRAEDLRRALGYRQWTLMGGSYGGALAQAVMSRHPASLRVAVLIAPDKFDDASWFGFVRNIDGTLRLEAEICNAEPACRRAFPDPEAELHRVAESLTRNPMTVGLEPLGQARIPTRWRRWRR